MPSLYIIAGPNGAGKSTVGPDYVPERIKVGGIFDGDKLFMNKRRELWRAGIKANKESKRLAWEFVEQTFDRLVEESLIQQSDFAYEGHFTNEATWDIPRKFQQNGYDIHLVFLGLTNVEALADAELPDWFKIHLPAIYSRCPRVHM